MSNELVVYQHKNEKQNHFHDVVMQCVARVPGFIYRYFIYGGGVRGGKTFVCLYILIQLARIYAGSRWHVIREDNPALEKTSIPSMEKLIGKEGKDFVWKRGKGEVQVVFANGSRIFFISENIQNDKELDDFLGLETNGVLLEQMETLSEKLLGRAMERIGSWIIDPMPIPLLLGTMNPTPLWPKAKIYDKFIKNELVAPWFYQPALPDDNPFVTQDQWANWSNLDEDSYRVMIGGIWSFKLDGNIWAYSFDDKLHVVSRNDPRMKIDKRYALDLIFDFNVDPMTCLVCQHDGVDWGRVYKEYRLRSSDIYELTARIAIDFPDYYLVATGDASGRNRNAGTKGAKSYVDTITSELKLSPQQVKFPTSNPSIKNTRILVNSLFAKHPDFLISDECLFLIDDLNTVKTDSTGEIDKKKIDPLKTHLLDNLRYFGWNYFRPWLRLQF